MSGERKAWGMALFADDIRHEIGGKYSVMGIYNIDMLLPGAVFPVTLPKLCVLIKYKEVHGAFHDDIQVNVVFPGDSDDAPGFTTVIPAAGREGAATPYDGDSESERLFSLTMPLVFSPLTIVQPGPIKVRIRCGEHTTRLGRLMVRAADPADGEAPSR